MDNFLSSGEQDARNIFNRFKKRDFSGTTGQAMKNSSYQLATNIVSKVGSLVFTIIIARLLLPELFGLYSLALSTILFFAVSSDLGIGPAILTFVSKELGRGNNKKAKSYLNLLLKYKIYLVIFSSGILLASAYVVSNFLYNKPIFYALLVGGLYLPATEAMAFLEKIFRAKNNFRTPFSKEILFQILRLAIVPAGIILLLKSNLSSQIFIALLMLILLSIYLISTLFLLLVAKTKLTFLKEKPSKLKKSEKNNLKKFVLPLSVTALSGIFFGYIDTLMLGRFVSGEYLAYYGAAFNLINSGIVIIGFAATALLPMFSRMRGKSLQDLFKKSRNIIFAISLLGSIFTYFVAWWAIRLAYGTEYLRAVPILRWFSILILILPLIGIYSTYLTSQKKTKVIARTVIISTILNIFLNIVGISIGLRYGMFEAVLGVTFATIISRIIYLAGLVGTKKRINSYRI